MVLWGFLYIVSLIGTEVDMSYRINRKLIAFGDGLKMAKEKKS